NASSFTCTSLPTSGVNYGAVFLRQFSMCKNDCATFDFSFADDNWIDNITVDGTSIFLAAPQPPTHANWDTFWHINYSCMPLGAGTHQLRVFLREDCTADPVTGPGFNGAGLNV